MTDEKIKCQKCGNEWNYTGRRPDNPMIPFYARCWVCGKLNRIMPEVEQ